MALKWTNTSSPPLSGVIYPKPAPVLNHLTEPVWAAATLWKYPIPQQKIDRNRKLRIEIFIYLYSLITGTGGLEASAGGEVGTRQNEGDNPPAEASSPPCSCYALYLISLSYLGALILLYWYLRWLTQAPKQSINSLTVFSTSAKILIVFGIGATACSLAAFYGFLGSDAIWVITRNLRGLQDLGGLAEPDN
jgi:hypothetical protein